VGIGLSLVAQFGELHGGRAWVQDRPGGGASFRVLLRSEACGAQGSLARADAKGSTSLVHAATTGS
jgi:K+-sensing histidine kinase KdpD